MSVNFNAICDLHIDEYALKNYITTNSNHYYCDICECEKDCIKIETLAKFIESCLNFEYGEPYEMGGGYDKEANDYEDSFPGLTVYHISDLLDDFIGEFDRFDYEIKISITEFIDNMYWTPKEMYGPKESDFFDISWEKFKSKIKYSTRYTYFLFEKELSDDDADTYVTDVLQEISNAIIKLNIIRNWKPGYFSCFRARQYNPESESIKSYIDLGSPPTYKANANRMSPAGIPMFYGAYKLNTAIKEIINITNVNEVITSGKFININDLFLIDFTHIRYISIFDIKNRESRKIIDFIHAFLSELSKPIAKDQNIHLEYVPTQFVTEYLRYYFKLIKGINVQGIVYKSSVDSPENCVVLFMDITNFTDDKSQTTKEMYLENSTIKTESVLYYKKFL